MAWKEIHQQASPLIPQTTSTSSFTQQSRGVGSGGNMGSESGMNHLENVRDHHHIHQHRQQHFHHQHPRLYAPHHPLDMHEAIIQREMEKERIREEIIMSEIVRRRVLEDEVRRELMMEREFALRRGIEGFPFGGQFSSVGVPLLGAGAEGRLNGRHEIGRFESLPFQRRSSDLRISEAKPVSEGAKEKEKIILMAKPGENISGLKRKAPTPPPSPPSQPPPPPPGADASEPPSESTSKKKAAEDLSCALCQVSATSEQGLSEHRNGKKHKIKEAALRAGKKYTIGLLTKRSRKSVEILAEATDPCTEEDAAKSMSESLLSEMTTGDTGNLNLKNELVVVEKTQNNEGPPPKKKKYKFWCEMCQVGAHTLKIMNDHKKGKKHLKRSKTNSGSDQQGNIVINENCEGAVAQDGEKIASENVDEAKGDEMVVS